MSFIFRSQRIQTHISGISKQKKHATCSSVESDSIIAFNFYGIVPLICATSMLRYLVTVGRKIWVLRRIDGSVTTRFRICTLHR
ncbi:hypothetical protein WI91_15235 [Burkholderia vietnamiensis]|uniref:Uncharacterized protein n=1 Tax=Burkholderia ubonensis TaxID=101571 RepID=A0A1B4LCN6_9BURK|nr:hypothetical protein WJ35_07645 [Burkholderia ubonensis]AOK09439.1 hypothetical protein WK31_03830 [Burkholderia vietnamiensis]KVE03832.1 hypothetical protein WI91_15235 [Burkholderia vietnamiensis]KVE61400.1 hypothetical protein WI96_23285 [Burkholderia vietnamiensis]KVF09272.1 hypothetical protein WJ04_07430 [Burkholderia vietnamiensis]